MNRWLSPQITRISKSLRSAGPWKRYQMFSHERSAGDFSEIAIFQVCETKARETGCRRRFSQRLAGHSMAAMNQHYTQLELAPLREAVAKLPRISVMGALKREET